MKNTIRFTWTQNTLNRLEEAYLNRNTLARHEQLYLNIVHVALNSYRSPVNLNTGHIKKSANDSFCWVHVQDTSVNDTTTFT